MLASPDHYQAMLITDAAVFYSRLTKWDEYFDGLPTHTIVNQLSFPIALARVGLARVVRLHCCRHRIDAGGEARGDTRYETQFPAEQGRDLSGSGGDESLSRFDGRIRGGRDLHDLSIRRHRRPDALGQPGARSALNVGSLSDGVAGVTRRRNDTLKSSRARLHSNRLPEAHEMITRIAADQLRVKQVARAVARSVMRPGWGILGKHAGWYH